MTPEGFYLAPVPTDPKNQLDVWVHSQQFHGQPLVQVVQSDGSFATSSENNANMPLNGYIRMDMYVTTLTQIYKNLIISNGDNISNKGMKTKYYIFIQYAQYSNVRRKPNGWFSYQL